MENFWTYIFWNNSIKDWAIALGIILSLWLVLRIFSAVVIRRLQKMSERTATTIDDAVVSVLKSSVLPFLYVLAFYYGFQYLQFNERTSKIIHTAILFVSTFYFIRIGIAIITYFFDQLISGQSGDERRRKQAIGIMLFVKMFAWIIGIVFLIDNLGYDITTIIAGLGIGGIAIALAAQAILGDLFSYVVIFFDKPFEIGDFITVDDKMGTIEYVGIKTTRIRALSGEQLICSNSSLTNSRVHNFKRLQERRILINFGVTYDTPTSKLRKIPAKVKEIIESIDGLRFDRAHFKTFGSFSLDFEVVYFVLAPEMAYSLDRQQQFNLMLMDYFALEKIDFAFPTQTLLLNNQTPVEIKNAFQQ